MTIRESSRSDIAVFFDLHDSITKTYSNQFQDVVTALKGIVRPICTLVFRECNVSYRNVECVVETFTTNVARFIAELCYCVNHIQIRTSLKDMFLYMMDYDRKIPINLFNKLGKLYKDIFPKSTLVHTIMRSYHRPHVFTLRDDVIHETMAEILFLLEHTQKGSSESALFFKSLKQYMVEYMESHNKICDIDDPLRDILECFKDKHKEIQFISSELEINRRHIVIVDTESVIAKLNLRIISDTLIKNHD